MTDHGQGSTLARTEDAELELDRQARLAALEGSGSLLLQAPAGSGKTTVLTARFLTLLTRVQEPEEILAITFTRKAAAEMRQRVMAAVQAASAARGDTQLPGLSEQLLQAVSHRDQLLGWQLARNPARLRIETIDALNSRLARSLPAAAHSAPELTIAAAPDALYQRAARRMLESAWQDPAARAAVELLFKRVDNLWPRLQALVADMLEHRSHWLPRVLDARGAGLSQRVQDSLRALIRAELSALLDRMPCALLQEGEQLLAHAAQRRACLQAGPLNAEPESLERWRALAQLALTEQGDWRRSFTVLQGFPPTERAMKARAAAWVEALAREPQAEQWLRAVQELPDARLAAADEAALEALGLLLVRAAAQLQLVFAETGKVDYAYMAGAARAALTDQGEPSDFALRAGSRLQHVLVDEFQDVSYEQFCLLQALTAGWDAGDGRTLFLVGDPMQSIYQFREAEVGLFLRARDYGLGALTVQTLQLRRNFRTRAPLLAWINEQFIRLFPAADDVRLAAIRYLPGVAVAGGAGPPAASQDPASPAVSLYGFATEDRDAEARQVLQIVTNARRCDPAASIAILVASREHATVITAGLRSAGMAIRGVNLEPLGERAAVRDLAALTRALLHGGDRTAWLALLRGPWCGVSLAALEELCEHDQGDFFATLRSWAGEAHSVQTRAADIGPAAGPMDIGVGLGAGTAAPAPEPDARPAVARLCVALAPALLGDERNMPVWQRVERCWLRLAGPAVYPLEVDRLAARRFIDALALHDDPETLVGEALGTVTQQLYSVEPPHPSAIEIMTMHAAKGLEWDVVILPGLGRKPATDSDPLLHWIELPRAGQDTELLLCPIRDRDSESKRSLAAYIKRMRRTRARLERVRLLYVAATRARSALHLLGALKSPAAPGEQATAPPGSLLELLWPALGAQFIAAAVGAGAAASADANRSANGEAASARVASSPAAAPAARGALWRLPPDWRVPPLPAVPRAERLPLGSVTAASEPEYSWVGAASRAVGTIVHAELHRLALQSPLPSTPFAAQLRRSYERWLSELGVPPQQHSEADARIVAALERTLSDRRGRWLLSGHHREAQSEWRLTGVHEGRIVNVVFDRMLLDEQGHRWIIDFKTSSHEGGALEEFIDRELQRHRSQLLRYASLARRLGPEPVRLALYFPLLGEFRELTGA